MLAAGKGTRMKSRLPKVLHRVCGREMVALVVDTVEAAELDPTVVVVPADSVDVRDALLDRVRYAEQSQPRGSGLALLEAKSVLAGVENVVVVYADMPLILPETLLHMRRVHHDADAAITILTAVSGRPDGLGRVIRSSDGSVEAIVEERDADIVTRGITEINLGAYYFKADWLWPNLENLPPSQGGEIYLTDLIALADQQGEVVESVNPEDNSEALGVNNRAELARAESVLRDRLRTKWMLEGVTIQDPATVYIDAGVELGQDTTLLANTHVTRGSSIGKDCRIGPNSIVSDSKIGDRCEIVASVIEDSTLEEGVSVGPFSHLRPGSHLERDVHIGNFAEVKNSRLGSGTKSGHFSFIGDADIGANVNIGAGTVTVNYDGRRKHRTTVGDGAFIGCDTMLIAPVTVGAGADTGAGAVVRDDVPPDSRVVGVPARQIPKKALSNRDVTL